MIRRIRPEFASVALAAFALTWVAPSEGRACTFVVPETRLFQLSAPPGETWWIHGQGGFDGRTALTLASATDDTAITAQVVGWGPNSTVILRVPESTAAGAAFRLPEDYLTYDENGDVALLRVTDAPPEGVDLPALPIPEHIVEEVEVRVGYNPLFVPIVDECGAASAPGIWENQYGRRERLLIAVPDGLALDVVNRPVDEEDPFSNLSSLNQLLTEAYWESEYAALLTSPPEIGPDEPFVIHSRFRRIADGAVGGVATTVHVFDGETTSRYEVAGCSHTDARGSAAASWTVLAFFALASLLRRRTIRP